MIRLLIVAALVLPSCSPAQDSTRRRQAEPTKSALRDFEPMPEIIGGLNAFRARITYPTAAREADVEGTVFVQFLVGPDGQPRQLRVLHSPDPRLSAEALRVVGASRFAWSEYTPEERRQTEMTQPVPFRLSP